MEPVRPSKGRVDTVNEIETPRNPLWMHNGPWQCLKMRKWDGWWKVIMGYTRILNSSPPKIAVLKSKRGYRWWNLSRLYWTWLIFFFSTQARHYWNTTASYPWTLGVWGSFQTLPANPKPWSTWRHTERVPIYQQATEEKLQQPVRKKNSVQRDQMQKVFSTTCKKHFLNTIR